MHRGMLVVFKIKLQECGNNVGMRFTFELQYCRGNWEMTKATEFKPEVEVLV